MVPVRIHLGFGQERARRKEKGKAVFFQVRPVNKTKLAWLQDCLSKVRKGSLQGQVYLLIKGIITPPISLA